MKEHTKALEKANTMNSGVAEHAFEKHHNIDLDNIRVLDSESNQSKRLVREALRIRSLGPSMNRDRGIDLPASLLRLVPVPAGRGRHDSTTSDVTEAGPDPQVQKS